MEATLQEVKRDLKSSLIDKNEIPGLELVEEQIYDTLSDSEGVIREMCDYLVNAGGKRIRPLLVIYSGLIFSELNSDLINSAVAAELIHMASLIHDDIIDNSKMRRNKPSVNKVWGNHAGVLCGDYLYSKAFGILSNNKLLKSLDFMVIAIGQMCCGEILQAKNKSNVNMNKNMYYEQIAQKTAILLEACCKSGAYIGGADEIQIRILGEFGLNAGLAFQIIDDLLDFCGNKNVMGKPKGEDLRQGILTLPVILLLQNEKHGHLVKDIIRNGRYEVKDILIVEELLYECGIVDESYRIANYHIEKAQKCLEMLPSSKSTEFLYKLADKLKLREN